MQSFSERLMGQQRSLLSKCWPYLLGFVIFTATPYAYLDLEMPNANGAYEYL